MKRKIEQRLTTCAVMIVVCLAVSSCAPAEGGLGRGGSDNMNSAINLQAVYDNGFSADIFDDDVKNSIEVAARVVAMTLDEKIYQLFFVTPQDTALGLPFGGVVFFASDIQSRDQVRSKIERLQGEAKTPLFIGVDEEGGSVARISGQANLGFDPIPPMREIGETGDSEKAMEVGKAIAENIKGLGFNVDFAPVADVITNPNNTEIGDRAFGTDPALVSEMVKQEVIGLHEGGVCTALKHFPGHGSTQANSHLGYSESLRTLDELRATEFLPFEAGIEADSDFVLISHMTARGVDEAGLPASLSKKIITDILRGDLGYENLVITDSMVMGAITDSYSASDAAVMAINAGVDMILIPESVSGAYEGVMAAIEAGTLTEARIGESVSRILKVKMLRGIIIK
ncbi:MAG: glycoside hydrolase family 3 protein [Clostridiales Family XIII bacterium]|nr:glycoside hydrolase family 3 protein [Clostridiales Family XIII bacterium]